MISSYDDVVIEPLCDTNSSIGDFPDDLFTSRFKLKFFGVVVSVVEFRYQLMTSGTYKVIHLLSVRI